MESVPELAVDVACEVGEGPLWHPADGLLYWVDIPRGRIYSFDPDSGICEMRCEGEPISGFTIQEDGSLLLFMQGGKVALWDHETASTLIESVPGSEDTIFNDCIADPEGRVFVGMKAGKQHKGQLYRLDTDCTLHLLLDGLGEPNGLGFTPDRKCLYFTDTFAHAIYLFGYDVATGAISNKRVFVRVPDSEGMPDGMTVDAEGCVWAAHWDGACVTRHSPDGGVIGRVAVPVGEVSSVTFGGEDYSDLYITTSGGRERQKNGPLAGSVFVERPPVRGVPEFRSKIVRPASV